MKFLFKKWIAGMTAAAAVISMISAWQPVSTSQVHAAEQVVAFPGAVGGGKYATGGRGGEVYHVTNLNDSGAGSFRDAVSQSGRVVVFDVSGTIELKSNILCQSNITIAGQTAPGGSGITLKNYKMGMAGDNIICRFISSRPGPYASTSSGNDAWGGAKGSGSIIDHCSMGWTTDEQWGLYSNNEYYTVQYSVLGPADSWGGHSKGLHGFGIMMGKGYLTFDHNLIIHNVSRNFRGKVEGQSTADFTNNIIYDWGYQTAYGTIGHLNYINNTLKAGNSTTGGYHWMYVDSGTKPQNFKVYCNGNRMINKDGSLHEITNDNWSGVTLKTAIGITKDDLYSSTPFQTLVNGEDVSTAAACESAEDSYEHVITYAGNGITPDRRTKIDQQCADETRNGTGQCSGTAAYDASQSNLDKYNVLCGVTYEYPAAVTEKTITDNDNDGMDDEWEELRGLNPNDPTDTNGDYCGQGYTNIEYYINDLTAGAFPEGVVAISPETAQLTGHSAFDQMEAESYDAMEGIRAEDTSDTTGGQNIGFIENGDYVMYKRLDFEEGAHSFTVRASGNACTMELYLDNWDTPAARLPYKGTGNFSTWENVSFNIPSITGIHNLYIKFTGSDGYLMNLNHFVFGKEAVSMNSKLIKNLIVSDIEHIPGWTLTDNTAVGSLIFGDRPAVTYIEVPTALIGTEAILTACDSKNYAEQAASFTAAQDITVYIGLDGRVEHVPVWMADYTNTGMVLKSSNDVIFEVYQKSFTAGETVNLGANGQSYNCMNYTVNVSAAINEPDPTETTEPETESATEPTLVPTESETSIITETTTESTVAYGDVDENGLVDIMDVILLNRNLMVGAPVTEQGMQNADVDISGKVDAVDSLSILKYVVKLITEFPIV